MVATGVGGQGAADEMSRCFSPFGPVPLSCQFFEDKIIVTPYAPIVRPDSPTAASLDITVDWGLVPQQPDSTVKLSRGRNGRWWVMHVYRLTLERGASGWRVVGAQLMMQS
jgi:hypothetical protein